MFPRIVSTEFTTGTVAGTRWLHTVALSEDVIVNVLVRPSGLGWSMDCDAETADIAAQAIGVVAQKPKGR